MGLIRNKVMQTSTNKDIHSLAIKALKKRYKGIDLNCF